MTVALGRRLTNLIAFTLALVLACAGGASAAQRANHRTPGRAARTPKRQNKKVQKSKGRRVGVPFPIPNPPPFHGEDGLIRVQLYNATEQSAPFTFATKNNKNCPDGNEWVYGSEHPLSGTTSPLDPGDKGEMYMATGACPSGSLTFEQYTDTGAFSFGVSGGEQFEFSIDVTLSSSFKDIHWRGEYAGSDNAKSLNLYNCGNRQIQGNGSGKGTINNNYKYDNNTTMCFALCPHSPEGERIPAVCTPEGAAARARARRRAKLRHRR